MGHGSLQLVPSQQYLCVEALRLGYVSRTYRVFAQRVAAPEINLRFNVLLASMTASLVRRVLVEYCPPNTKAEGSMLRAPTPAAAYPCRLELD